METQNNKYSETENKYIQAVMKKTGWSFEQASAKMETDRKKYGIPFDDYYTYSFWKVPIDVKGAKYVAIVQKRADQKLEKERYQLQYMAKVIHATGWSYEQALEKYEECKKRTGAYWSEYYFYHMYELSAHMQKELFLSRHTKMLRDRYNPPRELGAPIRTKLTNSKDFGQWFNREWCYNKDITKEDFIARFKGKNKVIYKPITGSGGHGVEVFPFDDNSIGEVFDKLVSLPDAIIEEYLIQHPELCRLCPTSVNTIRFATVSSNRKKVTADGKDHDIIYASLRIGRVGKHVDNFHSGGMVANIDLATGTIITDAADGEGLFFKKHPDTGIKFKGIKIPYFKEACEMINDILTTTKIEGYVGWDVAISEKGPMLIEKNGNPGPMLFTSPYLTLKKGTMDVIRKYLW